MGRGQLVFKGDEKISKKKKKKKVKHDARHDARKSKSVVDLVGQDDGNDDHDDTKQGDQGDQSKMSAPTIVSKTLNSTQPEKQQQQQQASLSNQMKRGTGLITVSGTVVTGYDTKFEREIHVGDAILIENEMRIVTMRLSNISMNVSSSFQNTDTSHPIIYHYISKPRIIQHKLEEQKQLIAHDKSQQELKQNVYDAYQNHEITYRERTEHGSYRYKKLQHHSDESQQLSRSDLLSIRAKKASDKYC